jgi:hypothetical protein
MRPARTKKMQRPCELLSNLLIYLFEQRGTGPAMGSEPVEAARRLANPFSSEAI